MGCEFNILWEEGKCTCLIGNDLSFCGKECNDYVEEIKVEEVGERPY